MRLTVQHVVDFGQDRDLVGESLVRPESWDALRTQTDGPFSLAATPEELGRQADERGDIGARAALIDGWIAGRSYADVASYGVGTGLLECWLGRLNPRRPLVVTEYAPKTIERLRDLFPNNTVVEHNLLTDPPLDADLHLFHRIDTELSDLEWKRVMTRFASSGVLVVATEVLGGRQAAAALRRRFRNPRATTAGWLRNRRAFEALWEATHNIERLRFGDLHAWHLTPR